MLAAIFEAAYKQEVSSRLKHTEQISLGELISLLEDVDSGLPITFDNTSYKPTGLCSFRGAYEELSICYGGCGERYASDGDETMYGYFTYSDFEKSTELSKSPTVSEFLTVLKAVKGNYLPGYKGGDYKMEDGTPIWVANLGESCGWDDFRNRAVVGVRVNKKSVLILTKLIEF